MTFLLLTQVLLWWQTSQQQVVIFSAASSSKQILKTACSTITNIDSRIVNNIWLNEKAKESNGRLHPIVVMSR